MTQPHRLSAFVTALANMNFIQRLGLKALNAGAGPGRDYALSEAEFTPNLKLDIYVPHRALSKPLDVVVFFYGGRWSEGARANYRFVGHRLVRAGFIVVIPDYRQYPEVRFPAFMEDGARALRWVIDHIGEYGGNAGRIHLMGHSAGGHIAALLATNPAYLAAEGKIVREVIHSFAGLAGAYAFTPDEPDLIDIFGPPAQHPFMQVPTFVTGQEPPMLLLHGMADTSVMDFNHEKLAAAITQHGGQVRVKVYPGMGHIGILTAFSWAGDKAVVADVVNFFRGRPGD